MVIIFQISYYISVWYILHSEKDHKKLYLNNLEMLQSKITQIITRAFKTRFIPVLNIKV